MTIALTLQKYLVASVVVTLVKTALFWFFLAIALICTIWACQGATIQQRGGRVLHQGIADDGELGIAV
jgi:hypothetical protein